MPDEHDAASQEPEPEQSVTDRIAAAIEEPAPGEEQQETPAEEQPAPPQTITIAGVEVPVAEAEALVRFREWTLDPRNQEHLVAFNDYLEGRRRLVDIEDQQAPVVPRTGEPAPAPEATEEELADLPPAVRTKLGELDTLREVVQGLQTQTFEDARARNQAAIDAGGERFKSRYGLDDAALENLKAETARTGIFPAFVAAAGNDVSRGTEDALEAVYFRNPANRQRELDRIATASKESEQRKRKASKLAGSGGTQPRTPDMTKLSPQQKREAMATEIAAMMRGGTEE